MADSQKYKPLRFVASLFRTAGLLLGLLVLAGGGFALWCTPATPIPVAGEIAVEPQVYLASVLVTAVLVLLWTIFIYATGEAIDCFVDIEVNTRRTMEAIEAESE